MSEIVCGGCFRRCRLDEGRVGVCHARKNENGKNICLNYGKITAAALDPIEKKPLARFYPGSRILSIGSFGCNLRCPFCQNDAISCADENSVPWQRQEPEELAIQAESLRGKGNIGLAFTYNEPMIGWEFVRDTAREVRKRGMKNVVVTNGSVSLPVLEEVLPEIDAFNIDLKGFTEAWYRRLGGDLGTVQAFIREAAKRSHVELTTLVVPGENDSPAEMRELSAWVQSVDRAIPLHITRFFPRHFMTDRAPTDIARLYELADIAKERLDFVRIGNI